MTEIYNDKEKNCGSCGKRGQKTDVFLRIRVSPTGSGWSGITLCTDCWKALKKQMADVEQEYNI